MTATPEEIRAHAAMCPHPQCQPDHQDPTPCTGFTAGSLYCQTSDCPNPRHHPTPTVTPHT